MTLEYGTKLKAPSETNSLCICQQRTNDNIAFTLLLILDINNRTKNEIIGGPPLADAKAMSRIGLLCKIIISNIKTHKTF